MDRTQGIRWMVGAVQGGVLFVMGKVAGAGNSKQQGAEPKHVALGSSPSHCVVILERDGTLSYLDMGRARC